MNASLLQIQIDLVLIGRCLLATIWGILYAVWLQNSKMGAFIADERTWLSVVIGIGVDMLLVIGSVWWQVWLVVTLSGFGVIARSLINASDQSKPPSGYKMLWSMEDSIAALIKMIQVLEEVLEDVTEAQVVAKLSRALGLAHRACDAVKAARNGEYHGKR
jgi:hypothetical protein